jgi:hypothetical protein
VHGGGRNGRGDAKPQRLFLARPHAPEPAGAGQDSAAHADRIDGQRNGKLWAVLGCMGADGQPQIQLQLYSAMLDHGLDIQQAIEMPRFLSGRFALGEARDTLHIDVEAEASPFTHHC